MYMQDLPWILIVSYIRNLPEQICIYNVKRIVHNYNTFLVTFKLSAAIGSILRPFSH